MQLPCHIQREFRVHERLFDMMDGARGHLEIGAVVVEDVDGRADEHADAQFGVAAVRGARSRHGLVLRPARHGPARRARRGPPCVPRGHQQGYRGVRVARRARLTGQHAGYLEWSSVNRFDRCLSCDLLEFTPRPHAGYFSDVNNQDAKLARDGDFVKAESIAFMDEAIDGELKLFSVADRE